MRHSHFESLEQQYAIQMHNPKRDLYNTIFSSNEHDLTHSDYNIASHLYFVEMGEQGELVNYDGTKYKIVNKELAKTINKITKSDLLTDNAFLYELEYVDKEDNIHGYEC
jgi:hypothetical protein